MGETDKKRVKKMTPADYIRKYSPIKRGMVIKDEDKPLTKYNKIMSKLYLGNHQAAKDKKFFETKKIKAVLNCSKDIPNSFVCQKDIEYMRIPVDDSLKEVDFEKMYLMMPAIVEFIHKHIVIQKHNILVNCWAGRQRSACAVAAYLIGKCDMTPSKACKLILEKRPEAWHFGLSLNFEKSLEKYYKDIQKSKK
jgi:protein-tyrosine phosphatase